MNRPLLLVGALALAAPARSQVSEGPDSTSLVHVGSVEWPNAQLGNPASVTRLAAGDLTGDGLADVAALAGTSVVMLYGPAAHNCMVALGATATDLDVARGAGPGHDAVAIVRSTGLALVSIDASGTISTTPGNLATSEWLGALKVRCADLDASGTADFVGLGANGTRILVHTSGTTPVDAAFDASETVLDLAPLRWEANVWRIAALTTAGVRVYDLTGTLLETPYSTTSGEAISVLDGAARDRIALLHRTSGLQYVTVLKRNAAPDDPCELPMNTAFALSSGDDNLDRDDEVLVSHTSHYGAVYLPNQFPVPPNLVGANNTVLNGDLLFSSPPFYLETTMRELPGTLNATPVLFADLDGDGRADALSSVPWAISPPGSFARLFPVHLNVTPSIPTGLLAPNEFLHSFGAWIFHDDDGIPESPENDQYRLIAEVVLDFRNAPWPAEANAVQVVVWRQDEPGSTLDHHAVEHYVYETGALGTNNKVQIGIDFTDNFIEVASQSWAAACFGQLYWMEIRPIEYESTSQTILQAFATRVCALGHGNTITGEIPGLVAIGHPDQMPVIESVSVAGCALPPQGSSGGGSSQVVTGVRRRRIPNYDPYVLPTIPTPPATTLRFNVSTFD